MKNFFLFILLQLKVFGFVLHDIHFDKSLQGGYKDFKIYNDTNVKRKYKITVEPSGKDNIGKYFDIVPKVITINPKDYAVVKLRGKAPKSLPEKEYEFMLNFRPIVIPTLSKVNGEVISGKSQTGLVPRVKMKTYSGVADYKNNLKLKSITYRTEKDKTYAKIKLENNTKGSVALVGNFYDKNKKMLASKFIGRVGSEKSGETEIELPNVKNGKDIKYLILRNDDLGDLVEFKL